MTLTIDTGTLSGVVRSSTYLAMHSVQGGRDVYSVRIPLHDLTQIVPVPDPNFVDADNRRVHVRHAKEFGQYLASPHWVAPTLLARDAGSCVFSPLPGSDGQVGYLQIPWTSSGMSMLLTIDGQHRILGVELEIKATAAKIQEIERALLKKGVRKDRATKLQREKEELTGHMHRLRAESVGVDIYMEPDSALARQMFVDVADNAYGISAAVRSRFDSSRVANRTLDSVLKHDLLRGRIDMEQDRIARNSANLLGAKGVADITKGVLFGITGRTSKIKEAQLVDGDVVEQVLEFWNCLCDAFPDMSAVADGDLAPQELRNRSLLGSLGMLRVLASVYRNLLAQDKAPSSDDVVAFFHTLVPAMKAPVGDDSVWRKDPKTSECFELGAHAPIMRQQNLMRLVEIVTGWYDER
ncbi:DNA sulfur modification protein DndB [Streptomyces sp. NBC_00470]|uniref:DNA sulfur modification protein DndB n=1 Tax=Streptomyces sp. NBC_00470 TaxID=2975753 RepID=UPI0030DEC19B